MITARVRRRKKKKNLPIGQNILQSQDNNCKPDFQGHPYDYKGPGEASHKRELRPREDQAPHLVGDMLIHQDAFLAIFRVTGNITKSARACDFRRNCIFDWSKFDETWDNRFLEAREEAADALEEAARVRAVDGIKEAVYTSQGRLCGYVTKYSDQLLRILLKANRPGKFGEHVQVQNNHTFDLKPMLDQVMKELNGNGNFLEYAREQAEARGCDHQDSKSGVLGNIDYKSISSTPVSESN